MQVHRKEIASVLMAASLVAGGCGGGGGPRAGTGMEDSAGARGTAAGSEAVVLKIHGMSCPLCATNIDKQLLKVRGVEEVKVNLSTGEAVVRVSRENPPTHADLEAAVEESGFTLVEQPG